MQPWALFSCSSLITLTAYNLAQLPKDPPPKPEPEPDANPKIADDAKFSLATLSQAFPEQVAPVIQPSLPAQPALSDLSDLNTLPDEPSPNVASPLPPQTVDLAALLGHQATPERPAPSMAAPATVHSAPAAIASTTLMRYRIDPVATLPEPSPLPALPVTEPITVPRETLSAGMTSPQIDRPVATPAFTTSPPAQLSTAASDSVPEVPEVEENLAISAADNPDLFAALPTPTAPIRPTPPAAPARAGSPDRTMAAVLAKDDNLPSEAKPVSSSTATQSGGTSMALALARYQNPMPQCTGSRMAESLSSRAAVCAGETRELTQRIPEAAVAGTPMPGRVESPTRYSPGIGVW